MVSTLLSRKQACWSVVVCALAVALVLGLLVPAMAGALELGSISGAVYGPTSEPYGPVRVTLFDAATFAPLDFVDTLDGTYSFPSVDYGSYVLGATDMLGQYRPVYWGSWSSPSVIGAGTLDVTVDSPSWGGVSIVFSPVPSESIAGTVTAFGGDPLNGAHVEALVWNAADSYWESVAWTQTDFDGSYLLDTDYNYEPDTDGAGTFKLRFLGPSLPDDVSTFVPEYYDDVKGDDASLGEDVTVLSGQQVIRSAELDAYGKITGAVADADDLPRAGIRVLAYSGVDDGEGELYWNSVWPAAFTGLDGHYVLTGVPAGPTRLEFSDPAGNFLTQFWTGDLSGTKHLWEATPFESSLNSTVENMNAVLAPATSVSGTVTDPGARAVADARVYAYQWNSTDEDWEWIAETQTSQEGTYTVFGLDPSLPAKVQFYGSQGLLSEWYNDKRTKSLADEITLADGPATGIDAQLEAEGVIKGHVSDGAADVPGIWVTASSVADDGTWDTMAQAETGETGDYTLSGLASGTYAVQFGGNASVLGEYYNNKRTQSEATTFTVTYGQTVLNINAALEPASKITGRVTNKSGAAISGAVITLNKYIEPTADEEGYWDSSASAESTGSGGYLLDGLEPGRYKVRLDADGYIGGWVAAPTGVVDDNADAAEYNLGVAATINVGTRQLSKGGVITGKLTLPAGVGAEDGYVVVYKQTDCLDLDWWDSSSTDEDGKYTIRGLPAGTYRIGFSDQSGISLGEFYSDKEFIEAGANYSVALDTTPYIVNATLAKGGRITGTVSGATAHLAEAGVSAWAWDDWYAEWRYFGEAQTSGEGTYAVSGLRTRTVANGYRLGFNWANMAPKWYNNKSYGTAGIDGLAVTAGLDVTGKNMTFGQGGSIVGTLTVGGAAPGPDPWCGVYAYVKNADGSLDYRADASPDETGAFGIHNLQPGQYVLRYYCEGYPEIYSGGSYTIAGAVAGTVAAGGTLQRSANLTPGYSIAGAVFAPTGGPVTSGRVVLFDEQGANLRTNHLEGENTYTFSALPPGSYKVVVLSSSDSAGTGGPTFFGDAANPDDATPIALTTASVTGKDVHLLSGSSISGTITAAATGRGLDAWAELTPQLPWMDGTNDMHNPGYYAMDFGTSTEGTYTAAGLFASAPYTARAGAAGYAYMTNDGMPNGAGTAAVTTPGTANFALKKRVKLFGQVFEKSGTPLKHTLGVNLWFAKSSGGPFVKLNVSQYLGRDGRFRFCDMGNVPPGYYKIQLLDDRGLYLPTSYKGPSATVVSVPEGTTKNLGAWYVLGGYPSRYLETSHSYLLAYPSTYWTSLRSGSYYGSSARKSRAAGAKLYTQFNGTKFTVYGNKGPKNGKFRVYIDGRYKGLVSTYYSKTLYRRALYTVNLAPGVHKVKLQAYSSAPVIFDRVYVTGSFQRASRW